MSAPASWDQPPNTSLGHILYGETQVSEATAVLPRLLAIDAVHTVMLVKCRLLAPAVAAELLRVNRAMSAELEHGGRVLDEELLFRGVYYAFERKVCDLVGGTAGAAAHFGRSRNDINATVHRMRVRDGLLDFIQVAVGALRVCCEAALRHATTLSSSFSHRQPGQPSSLGHYLSGVGFELNACLSSLRRSFSAVNVCPMGACAGNGTPVPIDTLVVAQLLGFSRPIRNSLAAVASRAYATEVLGALAQWCMTITRVAGDLQVLASHPINFLRFPDELVSTSSIMPQKRNAYVLEMLRARAATVAGCLNNALIAQKNTPFANDIEAGTGVMSHFFDGLHHASASTQLMRLSLEKMEASDQTMRRLNESSYTGMSGLADFVALRCGITFRQAHTLIANALRASTNEETGVLGVVAELLRNLSPQHQLATEDVLRAIDPVHQLHQSQFGGGAAPDQVRSQVQELMRSADKCVLFVSVQRKNLAARATQLDNLVREIVVNT